MGWLSKIGGVLLWVLEFFSRKGVPYSEHEKLRTSLLSREREITVLRRQLAEADAEVSKLRDNMDPSERFDRMFTKDNSSL